MCHTNSSQNSSQLQKRKVPLGATHTANVQPLHLLTNRRGLSECFIFRMVTLCELTWEESSAMRWRAAYSIMYQRQRFKNSWGSSLCLVLSAGLSLCMSLLKSVHCIFATLVGRWCLVKLSSYRQSLKFFLSLRKSLSVCFLHSLSQKQDSTLSLTQWTWHSLLTT